MMWQGMSYKWWAMRHKLHQLMNVSNRQFRLWGYITLAELANAECQIVGDC